MLEILFPAPMQTITCRKKESVARNFKHAFVVRSSYKRIRLMSVRNALLNFKGCSLSITKTCLFKYTENFTTKNEIFQIKNSDIFHISAQKIDCGYSLEPCRRGGSNEYPQSMF